MKNLNFLKTKEDNFTFVFISLLTQYLMLLLLRIQCPYGNEENKNDLLRWNQ